jgi:hypothetical protein
MHVRPPWFLKNIENGLIPSDDENDLERCKWTTACPVHETNGATCSLTSIRSANLWSYTGEHECRQYLARHLHHSSAIGHSFDKADAWLSASQQDVELTMETRAERDKYKEGIKKQQEPKKGKDKDKGKGGKSKGKGKKGDWHQVRDNWDYIQPNADADAGTSAASTDISLQFGNIAGAMMVPIKRKRDDDMILVPVSKLKIMRDTLERADHAMQSTMGTLIDAAKRLHGDQQGLHVCLFAPHAMPQSLHGDQHGLHVFLDQQEDMSF